MFRSLGTREGSEGDVPLQVPGNIGQGRLKNSAGEERILRILFDSHASHEEKGENHEFLL